MDKQTGLNALRQHVGDDQYIDLLINAGGEDNLWQAMQQASKQAAPPKEPLGEKIKGALVYIVAMAVFWGLYFLFAHLADASQTTCVRVIGWVGIIGMIGWMILSNIKS